jgi:hypothetical protein
MKLLTKRCQTVFVLKRDRAAISDGVEGNRMIYDQSIYNIIYSKIMMIEVVEK